MAAGADKLGKWSTSIELEGRVHKEGSHVLGAALTRRGTRRRARQEAMLARGEPRRCPLPLPGSCDTRHCSRRFQPILAECRAVARTHPAAVQTPSTRQQRAACKLAEMASIETSIDATAKFQSIDV